MGLMRSLLPEYAGRQSSNANTMVAYLSRDIKNNEMDAALERIQTFLGTVPYCDNTHYEGHY